MEKKQFKRKELYDLVWSKPLSQLAKTYNISDNGLRKICVKYEIPLPKMGHWQKVKFGKKISIEKLIPKVKWEQVKIVLSDREFTEKDHLLSRLARLTKEIRKEHPKLLKVSSKLTNPHSFVLTAQTDLKKKNGDHWRGFKKTIRTSSGIFSIEVTKQNIPRALRFIDAFIKITDERGHKITVNGNETILRVDDEPYKIRLREKHTRQKFDNGRYSSSDLVPNGILSLKLDALYDKEWKDGKVLLEEQLSKIIAAFELKAEDDKIKRAKNKAWWEESNRKTKIREREKAIIKWEEGKGKILFKHSANWNESQELKSFIEMVEKKFSDQPSDKFDHWIEWAKNYQKELDPLSNGIESFLNGFDFPES